MVSEVALGVNLYPEGACTTFEKGILVRQFEVLVEVADEAVQAALLLAVDRRYGAGGSCGVSRCIFVDERIRGAEDEHVLRTLETDALGSVRIEAVDGGLEPTLRHIGVGGVLDEQAVDVSRRQGDTVVEGVEVVFDKGGGNISQVGEGLGRSVGTLLIGLGNDADIAEVVDEVEVLAGEGNEVEVAIMVCGDHEDGFAGVEGVAVAVAADERLAVVLVVDGEGIVGMEGDSISPIVGISIPVILWPENAGAPATKAASTSGNNLLLNEEKLFLQTGKTLLHKFKALC